MGATAGSMLARAVKGDRHDRRYRSAAGVRRRSAHAGLRPRRNPRRRCIPASRRPNGRPRSRSDRSDPKCSPTTSSVPCCGTAGSRSRPASSCRHRASPRARCGTRSSTAAVRGGRHASPVTRAVLQGVHPANGRAPARRHGRRDERSRRLRCRRRAVATSSPTSRGPTPSPSSARCSARPAKTGSSSRCGPTTSSKPSASPPTSDRSSPSSCGPGRELDDYVDDMVAHRRHTLTDDLLSDLIRAEDDGDRLDAAELRMLAGGLLLAGTDTTRNQVAASVQVLLRAPGSMGVARATIPTWRCSAVDETMRHSPIAGGTMRLGVDDVELGGVHLPGGHHGARQHRCGQPRSRPSTTTRIASTSPATGLRRS